MTTAAPATLECHGCKAEVPLNGKRIGDSVTCPACKTLCVVIRSRTKGEVAPAKLAGGLAPTERREVAEALHRIKLRRIGQAARHVELYPSWAVFAAGLQFYLSAILAGQNLILQGEEKRGRFLRTLGVVSYVIVGAFMVALLLVDNPVPMKVKAALALVIPLSFGTYFTYVQHKACAAAREAGAGNAPVLLPLLVGLILAIAQAFAVWFVQIRLQGPLLG
jgi:hypothetical protein